MNIKEKAIYYKALTNIDEYIEERISYLQNDLESQKEDLSEYIKTFEADENIEESFQYTMLKSHIEEKELELHSWEQIKKDIAKF